jgi:hypothetical protein
MVVCLMKRRRKLEELEALHDRIAVDDPEFARQLKVARQIMAEEREALAKLAKM